MKSLPIIAALLALSSLAQPAAAQATVDRINHDKPQSATIKHAPEFYR